MATPCRKCGAEKTENVSRGILYGLAKALGYRLRMCSRCHRLRLLPRHPQKSAERPDTAPEAALPAIGTCPGCGKVDYRRSRRMLWEHLTFRGPMVRCRSCRARFPQPRTIDVPR